MKRTGILGVALVCCIGSALLCGLAPAAKAADDPARFMDVPADAWYYDSANFCHEAGVFVGDQAGRFQPDRAMTAQESYAVLARLHQVHTGAAQPFPVAPGESWSEPYLRYCVEHEIALEQDMAKPDPFTREDLVRGLSRIYDASDLPRINNVTTLADYSASTDLGRFVLALYRAGVLNGTDAYGSFSPTMELSRAECAAILTRLLDPAQRLRFEPAPPLTMELPFLTPSDTVYAFDGGYIYLMDTSDATPIYRVTDLYGRVVLESAQRIERQRNGIFQTADPDGAITSYYNDQGAPIFSWPGVSTLPNFAYGKLAVQQSDGSILVVDAQGKTLGTVEDMGNYRVAGPAFGDYIPVVPESGRKDGYSDWLDFDTGTVKELPYTVEWSLSDIGHGYLVVKDYDEQAARWSYNALDLSLELVFPQMMDEVQVYANGDLHAENNGLYYTQAPSAEMEVSSSGVAKTVTIGGDTNYTVVGRKLIHPHMVGGETRIDLLDKHGALEQADIPVHDIWYGTCGQILYRVEGQYIYISA